ncbi:MAG TPA: hypothetical protein VKV36_05495 [Acidimicrobiales bacterium]|nr:hypothetical protein [Acidimicrobiales bacterium]
MTTVTLEALRSDDYLGFLAAMGAFELLTGNGLDARLGWDGLGGPALLDTQLADVDAVAGRLQDVAVKIRAAGALVPASPQLIDQRRSQAERKARKAEGIEERNDPMRARPEIVRDRFRAVAAQERDGDRVTARWAAALFTMLGLDSGGDAVLTPLYAPTGQQVLSQLLEKYLVRAGEDGILMEALVGWRRRSDSGANLDQRDLRDAAWGSRGEPDNASVPGATWLALMAIPWFRQVGNGRRAEAVGWERDRAAVRPKTLLWPVWSGLRSPEAVEVLLSHPAVRAVASAADGGRDAARRSAEQSSRLRALGVVAVCKASRASSGNADGPLQATRVVWP